MRRTERSDAPDPDDHPENSVSILDDLDDDGDGVAETETTDTNGNGTIDDDDVDGVANPDDVMIYTPLHDTNPGHLRWELGVSLVDTPTTDPLCDDNEHDCGLFKTNGRLFEQLIVKHPVLEGHQGWIEVCINDRGPQWKSGSESFIESICDGTVSGSTWSAGTIDVPCILRERGGSADECSIDANDSIATAPVRLPKSFQCYVSSGDTPVPGSLPTP